MNDSAYINVYHTINPSKFYSYGTYISKVCFGLVPGTSDEYSFISNPITGHFIYKVSSKYLMPSSNPQNESEARNCLAEILSNLRDKISAAKNSKSLPEDFPVLFNNSHISTMNIAPVYDGQNTNIITSWKAVLGIELKVFNSLKSAKSMLESDSIIIEFSGKRIIEMDYNYTPIVKREEVPIRPNENSEFVLKKVNVNTIAPYYLTADGYIPACSKSVPVLQKPVSFGWSSPQPTHDSCKSMLTWSDIVEPTEDHPGSAKLVISMDYKVVTAGEGAVKNLNLINPEEFSRLFKLGNFPGEKNTGHLLLKRLPTKEKKVTFLEDYEKKDSSFNKYYKVTVDYEYHIIIEYNCGLFKTLKWMLDCPDSRGIMMTTPLLEDFETLMDVLLLVENESRSNASNLYMKNNKEQKTFSKLLLLVIMNIITDDINRYSNSNIYIVCKAMTENVYDLITRDIELRSLLFSINSDIFYKNNKSDDVNNDVNGKYLELDDFYVNIYSLLQKLIGSNSVFAQNTPNSYKYGCSCIGNPNFIILNPNYFSKTKDVVIPENGLTLSEALVHEAGHNSAKAFEHKGTLYGDYEYHQPGLQSNMRGKVYPTEENTIGIINDAENRQNMRIVK